MSFCVWEGQNSQKGKRKREKDYLWVKQKMNCVYEPASRMLFLGTIKP